MFMIRSVVVKNYRLHILGLIVMLVASGCGGGSSEGTDTPPIGNSPPIGAPVPNNDDIIPGESAAARLLTQATFGPSRQAIRDLSGESISEWLLAEFAKPASLHSQHVEHLADTYGEEALTGFVGRHSTTSAFWQHAVSADDQLRQRVAFALSEIIVVSNANDNLFRDYPQAVSGFQDILIEHAFGNYLDMITEVTYSPTMGRFLTYINSRKADPETGRVPDENYARELLQLFTIGLVALNMDGSPQTDTNNNAIELFDNDDITGLAKVFTGFKYALGRNDPDFQRALSMPMVINEQRHSTTEKSFLGLTIPSNTNGPESIALALQHIIDQPSAAPFISRQLIQRLVTSHPEPDYIERVAQAFETGLYELPNGTVVGEGRKGDLKATIAAILTDPDARYDMMDADVDLSKFGKVREPLLRLTHWARAFELESVTPELLPLLWDTSGAEQLNQHPYRASSVFNFFRPGYQASNTMTGAEGLTMPELQLLNASSSFGYINFMTTFITGTAQADPDDVLRAINADPDEPIIDVSNVDKAFFPIYTTEIALAADSTALVEHLAQVLITGNLSDATKDRVIQTIDLSPVTGNASADIRVKLAIILLMTSSDYLVQQ